MRDDEACLVVGETRRDLEFKVIENVSEEKKKKKKRSFQTSFLSYLFFFVSYY